MTGFDNEQIAEMSAAKEAGDYRPDGDLDSRTDEPCPFCAHFMAWDGAVLFCDDCRLAFTPDELAQMRRDEAVWYEWHDTQIMGSIMTQERIDAHLDAVDAAELHAYSFDEYNALRLNTGRNSVSFADYVTDYLAEHSRRMDEIFWPVLVYFGAVDELESNGDMQS